MSFATEKEKDTSRRFMLVRITPARYIGDDLEADGGLYTMTWSLGPIARIERNGVQLTEVSSTPSNNDEWYLDQSTGTLSIKLASAPDEETNVLVAFHHLFFTGDEDKIAPIDPQDPGSPEVLWEARVLRYPSLRQSITDILAGVFSIQDTSVEIEDTEGSIAKCSGPDDSFKNKDVSVWVCIGSPQNIESLIRGKIHSISFDGGRASFSFSDEFEVLNQPALMGDSANEAYFQRKPDSFPKMDPTKSGQTCKYIAGYSNRVVLRPTSGGTGTFFPEFDFRFVDGEQAVCTDFSPLLSTSLNRKWGLGRVSSGGLKMTSFGSIVRVTELVGVNWYFAYIQDHNFDIGDTITWKTSGNTGSSVVDRVGEFQYNGSTYNISFAFGGVPFTTSSTIVSNPKIGVGILVHPYPVMLKYGSEYTVSLTSTSGGNKYVEITLANNFEATRSVFGGRPLDPSLDQVIYRLYPADPVKHGDVLERILEACGLTTNAASFAAANAALDVDAYFSIPYFDESDFSSYLKYAEAICASTLGYLTINGQGEVEYHLFQPPASSDELTSDEILNGVAIDIDYDDIVTQLVAYNPHRPDAQALDLTLYPDETRESLKARYLHGVHNVDRFRHVLAEMSSRIDAHLQVRQSPRIIYSFDTATRHLDARLGDDQKLVHKRVLGGIGSKMLKVVGLDKDGSKVRVQAIDLGDLE